LLLDKHQSEKPPGDPAALSFFKPFQNSRVLSLDNTMKKVDKGSREMKKATQPLYHLSRGQSVE
jgi:hypothetical protein